MRFEAQASLIEAGEVLLPKSAPWLIEFITEILGFPNTRHDDQADALAQLLRFGQTRQRPFGLAAPRIGEH